MGQGAVVTDKGRLIGLYRSIGTTKTAPSQGQLGTGTTSPSIADTGLQTSTGVAINLDSVAQDFTKFETTVVYKGVPATSLMISEAVTQNTDGTPLVQNHVVWGGTSSGSTTPRRIIVTIVERVRDPLT